MVEWMLPFLAALGTGALSSWGVGGGTLLLVCMTLFLGVGHREAQVINLLFFLPTAGISLFFHRKNGFLDKETWRQASLPGSAAALAGALLSMAVDVSLLRKPFGLFLLYSGGSMLLSARKKKETK
ncbi:MAG: TSUP family transporter [Oscillospiraceae bacterium]|nr:TSUP family transporter [Oscillospiraceae bacterium]